MADRLQIIAEGTIGDPVDHDLIRHFFLSISLSGISAAADIMSEVEHGYADSDGVRIHYASLGEGPRAPIETGNESGR